MADSEIVEVVAQAIYEKSRDRESSKSLLLPSWSNMTDDQREPWRDEALAAIEAYDSALAGAGFVIVEVACLDEASAGAKLRREITAAAPNHRR